MSADRPVKWEEPRDSRKTSGDSVGIPAIHGGEDVNRKKDQMRISPHTEILISQHQESKAAKRR